MSAPLTYVIYAPAYSPNNGGAIFMHNLAEMLIDLGQQALFWPMADLTPQSLRVRLWRKLGFGVEPFVMMPGSRARRATRADLTREAVVIYPEGTLGNPLRMARVVRWLLYTPGLRRPYRFTPGEMFFRAGPMSDLPEVTGGAPDLYVWKLNPVYRDEGRTDRAGVCYMLRKGIDKPRLPETEHPDAICIDGKSHEEIAAIFNRCETFYSYDEATMYSQFAAIAGCTSIVVPGLFPDRAAWTAAHPNARYGVAYGTDPAEIAHARATRHLLLEDLQARERDSFETVRNFVALTHARFQPGPAAPRDAA